LTDLLPLFEAKRIEAWSFGQIGLVKIWKQYGGGAFQGKLTIASNIHELYPRIEISVFKEYRSIKIFV
jgi:hypothetical protein